MARIITETVRHAPIYIRTLRNRVVEYIPFTKRVPSTQDFLPNDDEHRLYEEASAFLQREILISLPAGQRILITMVLRKLLASSTFAISGTIRGLIGRLERFSGEIGLLDDDDLDGIEELEDELREAEDAGEDDGEVKIDPKSLKDELVELRRFGDLADGIQVNAKVGGRSLGVAQQKDTGSLQRLAPRGVSNDHGAVWDVHFGPRKVLLPRPFELERFSMSEQRQYRAILLFGMPGSGKGPSSGCFPA